MKHYTVLALSALLLGACTGPIIMGTDAAITLATKPAEPPPADIEHQIPPHESWCYQTMGDIECYAHIQDVPPNRLVMVDPPEHYPVDLHEYHEALTRRRAAVPATAAPAILEPAMTSESEKEMLKKEIRDADAPNAIAAPPPAQPVIAAPVQPAKKVIIKKKKHKKKPKPAPVSAPAPVPEPNPPIAEPVAPSQ
jgi:hypothetical protein